ncbi:phosphotransferase [Streptomyces sp. NPDC088745]|uniref:phosphotransferase n=1 Tax=Streptomyces sp. NPDC088745 TaxID=3365884 RepID=UPI0037F8D912
MRGAGAGRSSRRSATWRSIVRSCPVGTTRPHCLTATVHGDLHFANLTMDGPVLLDLGGHGLGPVGYDAATLYLYGLLAPHTAVRRTEDHRFASVLIVETAPDGRLDTVDCGRVRPRSCPPRGYARSSCHREHCQACSPTYLAGHLRRFPARSRPGRAYWWSRTGSPRPENPGRILRPEGILPSASSWLLPVR